MDTIKAVFNQRCKSYELIVVDDGSTDSLENHLSELILADKLKYIYQSNQGVSSARNKGAFFASSEYLLFLDSDDKVTENWLLDYENAIIENYPDIVYCGINRMKGLELVEYSDPRDPYANGTDFGNVLPGSFCIRKSLFDLIGGYDESLAYGENTELSFRMKMVDPSFAFINTPNLLYTIQTQSHGKNARNKMKGLLHTINKHPLLFNTKKGMKKRFLSIAGVAAIQCEEYSIARVALLRAWKLMPVDMLSLFRYLLSLFPWVSKKIWLR
jgi:glycosyltransferase involved in cell wall biosynthesis